MSELIKLTEKEELARQRVCFALDNMDVQQALEAVKELNPFVGMFKVGKELHSEIAWSTRGVLQEIYYEQFKPFISGLDEKTRTYLETTNRKDSLFFMTNVMGSQLYDGNIFLDLKFHDTQFTVGQASARNSRPGVHMMNLHISSGENVCKKAVEQAYEATEKYNKGLSLVQKMEMPKIIGVTVLTSLDDAELKKIGYDKTFDELVRLRTGLAVEWGLDGVVCPANKAGMLQREFGDMVYVTPGIEWAGLHGDKQKQLYTPDLAVKDCSNSILVIGSAIRKAEDRPKVAYEIIQAMAKKL
ncbi:orotidine 5'-phosphate decarboxylase [Candidatus Woesearchaeota archaeon]|nr:orotidine 5'-phosphate decarboxylase [Candidatus Woesearchaeota archaeon]